MRIHNTDSVADGVVTIRQSRHVFFLIGISGSGKSEWAKRHFNPHEIISLDRIRKDLAGEIYYTKSLDAASARLQETLLDVQAQSGVTLCIDNLNIDGKYRREMIKVLKEHHYTIHYVIMDDSFNLEKCQQRNWTRERTLPDEVIVNQYRRFCDLDFTQLKSEADVFHKKPPVIVREPYTVEDDKAIVIGDLQGEYTKLRRFLEGRNWQIQHEGTPHEIFVPPVGEGILVSCGDWPDRGEDSPRTVRVMRNMVSAGFAVSVMGNHDYALLNALTSEKVGKSLSGQTQKTANEIKQRFSAEEIQETVDVLKAMPVLLKLVTNRGTYIVSHGGVPFMSALEHNAALLPDRHRWRIINGGFKDGTFDKHGRRNEFHRDHEYYKMPGYVTQLQGHVNHSEERRGRFEAPFALGGYRSLESHIENGPQYDICYLEV